MAIPTTRTKEIAKIIIDETRCNGCGLCISVCNDSSLVLKNGRAKKSKNPIYGCYGCGHCMAVCPTEAIEVQGRFLSPDDLYDFNPEKEKANYEQLLSLFRALQMK